MDEHSLEGCTVLGLGYYFAFKRLCISAASLAQAERWVKRFSLSCWQFWVGVVIAGALVEGAVDVG